MVLLSEPSVQIFVREEHVRDIAMTDTTQLLKEAQGLVERLLTESYGRSRFDEVLSLLELKLADLTSWNSSSFEATTDAFSLFQVSEPPNWLFLDNFLESTGTVPVGVLEVFAEFRLMNPQKRQTALVQLQVFLLYRPQSSKRSSLVWPDKVLV